MMKVVSLIKRYFLVVFVFLILFSSVLVIFFYDTSYKASVNNASLTSSFKLGEVNDSFEVTDCLNSLIRNHELYQDGNSIAFVHNVDKPNFNSDGGFYKRLSVSIYEPRFGEEISLPDPRVKFYYSKGSSHWVHHCSGSYSTSVEGSIKLSDREEKSVNINVIIEMRDPFNDTEYTEHISINDNYVNRAIESVNSFIYKWDFLNN